MNLRRFCILGVVLSVTFVVAPSASAQEGPVITIDAATFTVGVEGAVRISAPGAEDISVDEDELPPGLDFFYNAAQDPDTAVIAGTPTTAGSFDVTVTAIDEGQDPDEADDATSTRDIELLVLQAPATPTPAPTIVPVATTTTCATLNASQAPATNFRRGDRFFVRGTLPGVRTVGVRLDGTTLIGSGTTDDGGRYLVTATVPGTAALGAHTIVVRGETAATRNIRATCGINVVAGRAAAAGVAGRPTLPRTGPDMPLWAVGLFAFTLVELGAGLLVLADGRRQSPLVVPHFQRFSRAVAAKFRRRRIF